MLNRLMSKFRDAGDEGMAAEVGRIAVQPPSLVVDAFPEEPAVAEESEAPECEAAPSSEDEVRDDQQDLVDFLSRWLGLSEAQRRALQAICGELDEVDSLIENSTSSIAADFSNLASNARRQSEKIAQAAASYNTVVVAGEEHDVGGAIRIVDSQLSKLVGQIVEAASQSMSMVYVLDDVQQEVVNVERLIGDVERLNTEGNLLALNAMIEASRAGGAENSFGVVAREMSVLSKSIKSLSERMSTEITTIAGGIRDSHAKLKTIAKIDHSENIRLRDDIKSMMSLVIEKNEELAVTLEETQALTGAVNGDVSKLISAIQFQDRSSQRLQNIRETLSTLCAATESLDGEMSLVKARHGIETEVDNAWLKKIIEERTLGEVRARYVACMLGDEDGAEASELIEQFAETLPDSDSADDDNIELF